MVSILDRLSQFFFKFGFEVLHIVNMLNIELLAIRMVYEHSNHTTDTATVCKVFEEPLCIAVTLHVGCNVFHKIIYETPFFVVTRVFQDFHNRITPLCACSATRNLPDTYLTRYSINYQVSILFEGS